MTKLLVSICMMISFNVAAQSFRTGDFLFQNLDCGGLCDAIEAVTQGYNGQAFSHIGLVSIEHDSIFVFEAVSKGVVRTPLHEFTKRSKHPVVHARLKQEYQQLIPDAIAFSKLQLGKAYDDPFLYDNGKYYCSELIYDAFTFANKGIPFFRLEPMTFKQPGTNTFFPVWVDYYKQLGIPIPEGEPGINPGGISRSDKFDFIR